MPTNIKPQLDLENFPNNDLKKYLVEEYVVKGKTYREVAKDIGVGLDTFHHLLKKHNIPARKTGKRVKKKE